MGVDLRLLPFDCDRENLAFSHTILDVERRHELWTPIAHLPQENVPERFTSFSSTREAYEDPCYGITVNNPYGGTLTYTTAGALGTLRNHPAVLDNHKNRAHQRQRWHSIGTS